MAKVIFTQNALRTHTQADFIDILFILETGLARLSNQVLKLLEHVMFVLS